MSRVYATNVRMTLYATALLSCSALQMIVTSCAGSEDEVGALGDETDGGSSIDVDGSADDAACKIDSDVCAKTGALACSDFEWCPVKTSHPIGLGLSSVWGSGPNDVWAVGAAGSVIHWDGHDWTSVNVATVWSLYAVWGTGPNDIWTVSAPNRIFHMAGSPDGAAQWTPLTPIWDAPRNVGTLGAIWGTSAGDVWVAGNIQIQRPGSNLGESGWRSVIVDGGIAWTPMSAFDNCQIRSIWGTGPGDVWLVGSKSDTLSYAAHTNGIATDGGIPVWTEVDTQSRSILYAVWGAAGEVWTVGDYGVIRHFTAGADMWAVVDSPTTEHLRGIWGTGPKDVWAVGEHGTILHYDGTSWRTSAGAFSEGEKPHLYGVWGSSLFDVWAVGSGIVMHYSGTQPDPHGDQP